MQERFPADSFELREPVTWSKPIVWPISWHPRAFWFECVYLWLYAIVHVSQRFVLTPRGLTRFVQVAHA